MPARAEPTAPAATRALANDLRPVLVRLGRELRKETAHLGVTAGQVTMLFLIADHPGIGLRELAERERVATATACGLVDRLERAALVERMRSQTDRRRVGLTITAAGRRILQLVRARRTVWLTERLDRLEPDERAAIEAALEPLASLLADGDAAAPLARRLGAARPR